MPKKITELVDGQLAESETHTGEKPTEEIMRKLRDVTRYSLPEELEVRLANYEDDDPVFCDHVRRAHKYYNTIPEARGQEPWKIEVKMFNYDEGTFDKYGPSRRETMPTPDELRAENAYGKLCFVVHYWTPMKRVKGMIERPGIISAKSKPFEILPPVNAAPVRAITPGIAPSTQTINLPPAAQVDAFQQVFNKANEMVVQAMNLQMDAIINRGKIVNEGIEKGKLLQQVEILSQANAELMKRISEERDDEPPAGVQNGQPVQSESMLEAMLAKYLPTLIEKYLNPQGTSGSTGGPSAQ